MIRLFHNGVYIWVGEKHKLSLRSVWESSISVEIDLLSRLLFCLQKRLLH